jgi:hypothetical protein
VFAAAKNFLDQVCSLLEGKALFLSYFGALMRFHNIHDGVFLLKSTLLKTLETNTPAYFTKG